jgi:putative sterol carrier protein
MGLFDWFGLPCNKQQREQIEHSFEEMVTKFSPDAVAAHTRAVIEYRIKRCGEWHVIIEKMTCTLGQGRAEKADLRLTTDRKTWMTIIEGQETGESVYMKGKLKARGDQHVMMQLENFFASRPSN